MDFIASISLSRNRVEFLEIIAFLCLLLYLLSERLFAASKEVDAR